MQTNPPARLQPMGYLSDGAVCGLTSATLAIINFITTVSPGWRPTPCRDTNELPQREGEQRQTLVTPHNRPASATPVVPPRTSPQSIRTGFLSGKKCPPRQHGLHRENQIARRVPFRNRSANSIRVEMAIKIV